MGRLCIAIFLSLGLALVANATKNQEKESKDSWLSSWRDWSYSFVSSAFRPVTALLANLLSNRNQQPEFSSGVKNVSAEVGQDAHLICYIKNDENIHVDWIRVKFQLFLSRDNLVVTRNPRISLQTGSDNNNMTKTYTLTIRRVKPRDQGWYMCRTENNGVMNYDKKAYLTITDPVQTSTSTTTTTTTMAPPQLEIVGKNVTAVIGQDAHLDCKVWGLDNFLIPHLRPVVTWINVQTNAILTIDCDLFTSDPRISAQTGSGMGFMTWTLIIKNVKTIYQGAYRCHVNTDPVQHEIVYLNVVTPTTTTTTTTRATTATAKTAAATTATTATTTAATVTTTTPTATTINQKTPDFTRTIQNVTAAVGQDLVHLDCYFRNDNQMTTVAWIRVEDMFLLTVDEVVFTSDQRVSASVTSLTGSGNGGNEKRYRLTIKQVQKQDQGAYECQINLEPRKFQVGYLTVVD